MVSRLSTDLSPFKIEGGVTERGKKRKKLKKGGGGGKEKRIRIGSPKINRKKS